jgi:hypothetical protein
MKLGAGKTDFVRFPFKSLFHKRPQSKVGAPAVQGPLNASEEKPPARQLMKTEKNIAGCGWACDAKTPALAVKKAGFRKRFMNRAVP